ncbi:MAG: quinate 5-dehydrogenase [Chloroflexota bacterium]
MKKAVSVSLGSSVRDACAEIDLLGERVSLRREGWDGDVDQVTNRFQELDGHVDSFGVGGIDLWVHSINRTFSLNSAHKLIKGVKQTPIVDGSGLKNTLEKQTAVIVKKVTSKRKVMVVSGLDRLGMTQSFFDQDFDVLCGDAGFALGIPLRIKSLRGLARLGASVLPVVSRLPIHMIYPTGGEQHKVEPKFDDWYAWADIIAGDCLYIKRHMPPRLDGKVVVTNTTTAADRVAFRKRGVQDIITTTPVINGRSFGTNLFEAGLTAAAGKNRPLTAPELQSCIEQLDLKPTVIED